MKKKILGLISLGLIFIVVLAVNYILSSASIRVDCTEEKLYTLSDGTCKLLEKLDAANRDVTFKFYFSESSKEMPASIKAYARQVRDLLKEYTHKSSHVILEEYDPKPFSEAEKTAKKDNLRAQRVNPFSKETWYLGLVIVCGADNRGSLPFFNPQDEAMLEYEITRLFAKIVWPEKPVIGVMSGIPGVLGAGQQQMMMMGQAQQPPWTVFQLLTQDEAYDVREVSTDVEAIDPKEYSSLIVIHPKNLSEKAQFAIDQYVIGGGKLIAFVDPYNETDANASRQQNPMMRQMGGQGGPSSLDKLFEKWGVSFDTSQVVADIDSATPIPTPRGEVLKHPAILSLSKDNLGKDVLTDGLQSFVFPFAGAFDCKPPEGLTFTPVITSSTNACLVNTMMAQYSPDNLITNGMTLATHVIAGRLEGTFHTAFPKGPDWTEGSTNTPPHVVESGNGFVFLIADADCITDYACGLKVVRSFLGDQVRRWNDNYKFFLNAAELFSGHEELIKLRSRSTSQRPFTRIDELEKQADKDNLKEIQDLRKKKQDAERRLQEKFRQTGGNLAQMSQDLEAEIENLQKESEEADEKIYQNEKTRYAGIEKLGLKLKLLNIILIPLLVIVFGVLHAVWRRIRR